MLTAGRSWKVLVQHFVITFVLAGFAQSSQHDQQSEASSHWKSEAELFRYPICLRTELHASASGLVVVSHAADDLAATAGGAAATAAALTVELAQDQEQDTDSLLGGSSFLSFGDWKKQNLAKGGQPAENAKDGRQQTGINNALDSLGDDAEIELDFGGFGAETPAVSLTSWGTPIPTPQVDRQDKDVYDDPTYAQGIVPADVSRRKDAGTTCKERFNYASFDCAATVLKTNSECKGSSSVLLENKDSYMLNECRAKNKFLILELCDDILVDTVVLANYEFFSSIFHTFRVSVSDRYPAKPDQWKELGIYEARNTREVQAFAVANSLIWARYLRIEFLTHYGHEFYCPVSLIRVHGTTMMEEYKHDESVSREEPEVVEESAEIADPPGLPNGAETESQAVDGIFVPEAVVKEELSNVQNESLPDPFTELEMLLFGAPTKPVETCGIFEQPMQPISKTANTAQTVQTSNSTVVMGDTISATQAGSSSSSKAAEDIRKTGDPQVVVTAPGASTAEAVAAVESAQQNTTAEDTGRSTSNAKEEQTMQAPPSPEPIRPTSTQPPSANPTTQESFFKSVHKRLQMLESNSSLSLLYIEDQSRILRDAFNKVEKRQLAKTTTFLENLNVTVLNELKEFREQYDQVWKTVAFEFEHQRVLYRQEVHALSAQLGVLADELVSQKRVTLIQSIMVLCCFALVLFSRGNVSNYMEFPRVQRMVNRSYSLRPSSPIFASASPSASPSSTRPTSSYHKNAIHRRNLSDSSSTSQEGPASPTMAYVPPTPTSDLDHEPDHDKCEHTQTPPTPGTPLYRSQSVPLAMNGKTTSDLEDEDVELAS
ncbi:hypothetical protein N7495_001125 [Penicillium taxi]|uniref:uncharacterized protein n=1 Tax=Penicillium taxi TaxID=168475 RepID=UPI0025454993|nr:uncharacterized protein N7495_001125 [Penicillium taxi]KAJ5908443.1 hypothetical protein N7495_001125 [Penicillium taxi]